MKSRILRSLFPFLNFVNLFLGANILIFRETCKSFIIFDRCFGSSLLGLNKESEHHRDYLSKVNNREMYFLFDIGRFSCLNRIILLLVSCHFLAWISALDCLKRNVPSDRTRRMQSSLLGMLSHNLFSRFQTQGRCEANAESTFFP